MQKLQVLLHGDIRLNEIDYYTMESDVDKKMWARAVANLIYPAAIQPFPRFRLSKQNPQYMCDPQKKFIMIINKITLIHPENLGQNPRIQFPQDSGSTCSGLYTLQAIEARQNERAFSKRHESNKMFKFHN